MKEIRGQAKNICGLLQNARTECMEALFKDGGFDDDGKSESVTRIVKNYELIEEKLNEVLDESRPPADGDDPVSLESFIDWLIENVYFIEVTASSDADAYAILETLNDRGLPLTPAELLKSYLLSSIDPGPCRHAMNERWKKQVARLRSELGYEQADADAIKTWLRSQYMELPNERTAGNESDRDRIGSDFHRWFGTNAAGRLKLRTSADFCRFIERDFVFFARESGLPFEPADDFKMANIEAREELYQKLGRRIWSMEAIREAGNG